ncbi:hypothetical protein CDD82_2993 [Ophiocordyceps australis]|uniref:Folylpolyglutamate synthase n=1 Tax=Ophiocordyceps australis TaxID=1399860 RepID=A0A2C5ZV28_9HYPO|nr:hypothetical protein CDD82_2993 [Ophiocordyceps australis]
MASSSKSYADAIDALNSLQTPHSIIQARRKAGIRPDASSMREMRIHLSRIGYTPAHLDSLNIVHVAGTKGKGSTCAFVDSILGQYRRTDAKPRCTGLFTSPHLLAVRERIRINSKPLCEERFARYFFDVWDRLGSATDGETDVPPGARPIYGRFLTLMSWHAFLQEGVDTAVYETGIGGEYDATNLVQRPVATGITSLGIDHVYLLGDTIDKIAWHKAGIMKPGSPAFTVEQVPEAAAVLRERAHERHVDLKELQIDSRLSNVKIKPSADFQKKNATLAVALAQTAMQKLGVEVVEGETLPQQIIDGLEQTVFRGRCEVMTQGSVTWYLDGAHTADSLKMSSQWFSQEATKFLGPRVLIFNQQDRSEAVDFLNYIRSATSQGPDRPSFDHAIFCTNVTHATTGYRRDFVNKQIDQQEIDGLTVQRRLARKWTELDAAANVLVMPSIEHAVDYAHRLAKDVDGERIQVYVTGSFHLVGGTLGILEAGGALE